MDTVIQLNSTAFYFCFVMFVLGLGVFSYNLVIFLHSLKRKKVGDEEQKPSEIRLSLDGGEFKKLINGEIIVIHDNNPKVVIKMYDIGFKVMQDMLDEARTGLEKPEEL